MSALLVAVLLFCAVEAGAITIGPSRLEVSLPPGEIAEADYYVQNDTDAPMRVLVEPENWFRDAYNYGSLAIGDWITLDTYEFALEPKEIKKLKLIVRVPTDVKGERVAQIFFTSIVGGDKEGTREGGVRARLGAILYVAIKGTEKVSARIKEITAVKARENGAEKLKIGVRMKNRGNIHLRPTGKVVIKDESGRSVSELDLLPARALLPNRENTYYAYLEDPGTLKPGKYKIYARVDYGMVFDYDRAIDLKKRATFRGSFTLNAKNEVISR
jgi:hypothetical protein